MGFLSVPNLKLSGDSALDDCRGNSFVATIWAAVFQAIHEDLGNA